MWIRDGKNSDPGSGMEKSRIRDPGWKKVGSGARNPEKHPGSATLVLEPILCLPSQKDFVSQTKFVHVFVQIQLCLWGSLIRKSGVTFFEVGHYGSLFIHQIFCRSQSGCYVEVFEELLLDADWALNAGNWMWLSASAFFHQYFRFDLDLLHYIFHLLEC
jgi:hypothetical protein